MKRIAIIVGHTKSSPGATNYKGESEYSFNGRVADKIAQHIKRIAGEEVIVRIFFRDGIGRSGVASLVKEWRADLSLELHFNSFRKAAYGCEILVHHRDTASIKVADEITDELAEKFMLKERHDDGVKKLDDGDRGYYNLKLLQSLPLAMLIEPCFANIETAESRAIFEDEDRYAAILGNELVKAVGVEIRTVKPISNDVDVPTDDKDALIASLQEKIRKQDVILDTQHEAWIDLSNKMTQAIELLNDGIQEVIVKSQDAWLSNQ